MRTISRTTLTLAAICALLTIWQPIGTWWQWLTTGIVLLLIGAGTGAAADGEPEQSERIIIGHGGSADDVVAQIQRQEARRAALRGSDSPNGTGSRPNESDAAERHTGPRSYGRSGE